MINPTISALHCMTVNRKCRAACGLSTCLRPGRSFQGNRCPVNHYFIINMGAASTQSCPQPDSFATRVCRPPASARSHSDRKRVARIRLQRLRGRLRLNCSGPGVHRRLSRFSSFFPEIYKPAPPRVILRSGAGALYLQLFTFFSISASSVDGLTCIASAIL